MPFMMSLHHDIFITQKVFFEKENAFLDEQLRFMNNSYNYTDKR
jgi:hypothetical protein